MDNRTVMRDDEEEMMAKWRSSDFLN